MTCRASPSAHRAVAHIVSSARFTPVPAATPSVPAAADPLALLNAEIAARNRGDVNAAVALFADNATFTTAACQPCTSKPGIVDTLQHLLIDQWQITPFNNQVSGNTVTGKSTLTSDSIRARGFQRIIANDSLTEQNGLIINFTSAPDPSDPETMQFLAAASQPIGRPPTLPSTGVGSSDVLRSVPVWEYAIFGAFTIGFLLTGVGMRRRTTKRSNMR